MILEEVCIRHHGAGIIYKEGEGKGVKDGEGVTELNKKGSLENKSIIIPSLFSSFQRGDIGILFFISFCARKKERQHIIGTRCSFFASFLF